ncbi:hypothetical protein [Pedobacter sp. JY14-1]|uniref:hypothetical protein n=1 Tax=Pedobacter sp. JY14-1 TaxID=3034151 RepID=UPI0023E1E895|nr:hypothetical protein [Pedobacter sp. JY14-1]
MVEQEPNNLAHFAGLVSDPGRIGMDDAGLLKDYAAKWPYFRPLYLLQSIAEPYENRIKATAALYNGGVLLHRALHQPEELVTIARFSVVRSSELENQPDTIDEAVIDEVPEETALRVTDEQETYEEIGEIDARDYLPEMVSADFFAFEGKAVEGGPADERVFIQNEQRAAGETVSTSVFPHVEEYDEHAEREQIVSKYDDDKLPYTFLWWLARTRKEHEQIFQPYAVPKQTKPAGSIPPASRSELQQQYVEHIFHVQSPFAEEVPQADEELPKRNSKEDEIIENFLKNEPQISTPRPEQINNENKARKSAEDHSSLVSETLAGIYIEQMLYDKAIETYEKLSLMFPEKRRYFADLIQSIEKKI